MEKKNFSPVEIQIVPCRHDIICSSNQLYLEFESVGNANPEWDVL